MPYLAVKYGLKRLKRLKRLKQALPGAWPTAHDRYFKNRDGRSAIG